MKKLDKAKTQVFLLGIGTYDDENLHDLDATLNNIAKLRELFKAEPIGIPTNHVRHMVDTHDKSRLLRKLKQVVKQKGTKNLILYYAGHSILSDNSDKIYFALSNSNLRYIGTEDFSLEELEEKCFSDVPNLNVILILDSCFSERAFELVKQRNYCIIASSAKNTPSKYPQGETFSAFTKELIDVLENGIDNGEKNLSFQTIYKEVKKRLCANNLPKPRLANTNDVQDLLLTKNLFGIFSNGEVSGVQKNSIPYIKSQLNRALVEFNYTKQKDLFDDYLMEKNIGAIVIHGEPEHGQNWLFKTLLYFQKIDTHAKLTSLGICGKEPNLDGIIETLKQELETSGYIIRFRKGYSLEDKVTKVSFQLSERLKAGDHIVIGFRNLIRSFREDTSTILRDFIEKIWLPIHSKLVSVTQENDLKNCFLLFFVEDTQFDEQSVLYNSFSSDVEICCEQNIPLILPPIEQLSTKDFHSWIKSEIKTSESEELSSKFGHYQLNDCKSFIDNCPEINHVSFFRELFYEFDQNFEER